MELYFFLGKVIDFSKVQYTRKIIKILSKLQVSRGIFQKGALLFSGGAQNFKLAGAKSLQEGQAGSGGAPLWKKARAFLMILSAGDLSAGEMLTCRLQNVSKMK